MGTYWRYNFSAFFTYNNLQLCPFLSSLWKTKFPLLNLCLGHDCEISEPCIVVIDYCPENAIIYAKYSYVQNGGPPPSTDMNKLLDTCACISEEQLHQTSFTHSWTNDKKTIKVKWRFQNGAFYFCGSSYQKLEPKNLIFRDFPKNRVFCSNFWPELDYMYVVIFFF
jgi:hypothetical protein